MVCVGNPTAASAGLQTLLKGGNAIDAAITVATCQPVVEPTGNGLGSDCFALIWYKASCMALTAAGRLRWLLLSQLEGRGFDKIPPMVLSRLTFRVSVGAWMEIHKKFGKLLSKLLWNPPSTMRKTAILFLRI